MDAMRTGRAHGHHNSCGRMNFDRLVCSAEKKKGKGQEKEEAKRQLRHLSLYWMESVACQ